MAIVSVILVSGVKTAVRVCVRCCVASGVNTLMVNASVIQDGRAKNAHCDTTSAKCQTAMAMATVPMASATVLGDTRVNFVRKLIVHIPLALDMDSVLRAVVYVRRDGRGLTAAKWTKRPCSVCLTAVAMETLIWRVRLVIVNPCGLVMIVLKVKFHFLYFFRSISGRIKFEGKNEDTLKLSEVR